MHVVTVLGDAKVGKTALCEQWTSETMTTSYVSTIAVNHYRLPDLTIHDTPSDVRFHMKMEHYLGGSDVFVLVGNRDCDVDHWWARIQPLAPNASWLFVWTGDHACPKRRFWAKHRNIPVVYVDIKDAHQVAEALRRLTVLAREHEPRPERVPLGYYEYLMGEARLLVPCV